MSDRVAHTSAVKHIKFQFIASKYEARAMINFLSNEILRHKKDIKNAHKDIKVLCERFNMKPPKFNREMWYETREKERTR